MRKRDEEMNKINFTKIGKQIRKEQKDKQCWKCKNFKGFYYDEVTFDCKVEGDNCMWSMEGINCKHFNPIDKGKV